MVVDLERVVGSTVEEDDKCRRDYNGLQRNDARCLIFEVELPFRSRWRRWGPDCAGDEETGKREERMLHPRGGRLARDVRDALPMEQTTRVGAYIPPSSNDKSDGTPARAPADPHDGRMIHRHAFLAWKK